MKAIQAWQRYKNSFLSLCYPPLCLHCHALLPESTQKLCLDCLCQLEIIDPQERCARCFSLSFDALLPKCKECSKWNRSWENIAAAFEYIGPASTLVRQLKYGGQSYLAEGCAAYMAVQYLRLKWPLPDLIIPVPMPLFRKWDRGYNQTELIAKELGRLLCCSVENRLRRDNSSWSQAGLTKDQRHQLQFSSFYLNKGPSLSNKRILLVDDVITTGTTLRCCAEVILGEYPVSFQALAFCTTV